MAQHFSGAVRSSDPSARAPRTRPVASVARALALLDALCESEHGLGVNELARRIAVSPSTASRLLATLEGAGMVQRDGQGPFRLGLGLVTLADRVLARLDLRALARPVLVELMERTGETATLSIPGEREAITVDSVPSRSSVVSMARLGRPSVSHATAVGKVMLAFGGGPLLGPVRASSSNAPGRLRGPRTGAPGCAL